MTVKEIRQLTGLSQVKFGEKYGIPTRTVESWEASKGSVNYREAPEYVVRMLERIVKEDMVLESMRKAEA